MNRIPYLFALAGLVYGLAFVPVRVELLKESRTTPPVVVGWESPDLVYAWNLKPFEWRRRDWSDVGWSIRDEYLSEGGHRTAIDQEVLFIRTLFFTAAGGFSGLALALIVAMSTTAASRHQRPRSTGRHTRESPLEGQPPPRE